MMNAGLHLAAQLSAYLSASDTAAPLVAAAPIVTSGEITATTLSDTFFAIMLLVIAVILLLLEFLVVSFGLLGITALGFAIAGIWLGFASSAVVGWIMLAISPVIAFYVISWGLSRLQRSQLVPKAEISDDAGYRHASNALGVQPGSIGTLTSDAFPTGRARFAGGEIDVLIEGPSAAKGATIAVDRIEGPTVIARVQPTPPTPAAG
jgi:membrane-bound ClpP family serine protease